MRAQLAGFRSFLEPTRPASGNFGDFFRDAVRLRGDRTALIQGERSLTYGALDRRCGQVANLLAERGVGKGTRVALLFENGIEVIELTFGAMRAGAVPVPLNTKLPDDALAGIVAHSDARLLVAGGAQAGRAEAILGRGEGGAAGEGGRPGLLIDADSPDVGESYRAARDAADPSFETVPVAADDVSMQPYTSGSTGEPKGVLITHGGSYWCVNMLRRVLFLEPSERALVAVPLYHKNGMLGAVKPFLMAGGSVVILDSFDASGALRAIERHGVTYLTGVPAIYRLMLQEHASGDYDLSSLDWGIVGSADVPGELFEQVEEAFGMRLVESYGITEGGPEVALTPRWGRRRIGWSGLVVPGVEVRVADPDDPDETLPTGEVGELLVRSPGVAKGYYEAPEATAEHFLEGGWLRTGDLARLDDEGYVKVEGRIDDMINAGGEHVFPSEVEDRLLAHPGVRDACVVAQPHPVKGEVPVAFVVRHGGEVSEEDVRTWCLDRGPAFAHPRRVYFRDSLPLGGTGKVDRQRLATEAAELVEDV